MNDEISFFIVARNLLRRGNTHGGLGDAAKGSRR
jgi:hypothetical protein